MSPQGPLFLRAAALTTAALIFSLSMGPNASAQAPGPRSLQGDPLASGAAPGSPPSGFNPDTTMGSTAAPPPVLTPGYFEVVCPAICYGGAFHLCGRCAFGGAGYYGPFRRYWGYSTYGPNINIGPDNSIQYGLQGGVIYEAMRRCKGLRKHGCDPGAYAGFVPMVGGTGGTGGSGGTPLPPTGGTLPRPTGGVPAPPVPLTDNSAHLRLLVPENAEVLVEGSKTTTTGTVREFVSPPLQPGKNMIYSILVRYSDAGGKPIEETHSIRVHANDQLNIDCTKPANAAQMSAAAQRP